MENENIKLIVSIVVFNVQYSNVQLYTKSDCVTPFVIDLQVQARSWHISHVFLYFVA